MTKVYVFTEYAIDYDDYPIGNGSIVCVTDDEEVADRIHELTWLGYTTAWGKRGTVRRETIEVGFLDEKFAERIKLFPVGVPEDAS
jgi:hypothetical protein